MDERVVRPESLAVLVDPECSNRFADMNASIREATVHAVGLASASASQHSAMVCVMLCRVCAFDLCVLCVCVCAHKCACKTCVLCVLCVYTRTCYMSIQIIKQLSATTLINIIKRLHCTDEDKKS